MAINREELTRRALEHMRAWNRPIIIEADLTHVVGLIGLVQLALRHPEAGQSATARMTEQMIRDLIETIDPAHGELYQILHLGFDPEHDM